MDKYTDKSLSKSEYPIITQNLTKKFGDLYAVHQMNLSVGNEIFGILGPNGSGKTTTVLMLTTLLEPTDGTASICGYDIHTHPRQVRDSISYVPQDMAVDVRLSGRENVMMFAELYGVRDPARKTEEALRILELADRADERAKVYSGGMRRRLELAQALVHNPKVLFLDEPTVGLDVAARKKIWEHIKILRKQGMTIFVTTHYMDEADRLALIYRGKIIAEGTPSELRNNFMTHDVLEMETDRLVETIDVLSKHHLEAAIFGSTLHLTVEKAEEDIHYIEKLLQESGIELRRWEKIVPSLEDVFVTLIEVS